MAGNLRRHRLQFSSFKRILLKPCSRAARNERKQTSFEPISEKGINFFKFEFLKSNYIFSLSRFMNYALNLLDVCTIISIESN